jgi:hypothetical protein
MHYTTMIQHANSSARNNTTTQYYHLHFAPSCCPCTTCAQDAKRKTCNTQTRNTTRKPRNVRANRQYNITPTSLHVYCAPQTAHNILCKSKNRLFTLFFFPLLSLFFSPSFNLLLSFAFLPLLAFYYFFSFILLYFVLLS